MTTPTLCADCWEHLCSACQEGLATRAADPAETPKTYAELLADVPTQILRDALALRAAPEVTDADELTERLSGIYETLGRTDGYGDGLNALKQLLDERRTTPTGQQELTADHINLALAAYMTRLEAQRDTVTDIDSRGSRRTRIVAVARALWNEFQRTAPTGLPPGDRA